MFFIKKTSFIILSFLICFGLLFANNTMAKKSKYRFKLATLAPKSVGWATHIRKIIHPAIKRYTDGEIKLKWYWGGVMGEDKDYIQKMKLKQLDGAAFTGAGVVLAIPEIAVLELPFMFNNYDEVDYIRKKMWKRFDKLAIKHGYKIVVWSDQDFDQIYSVKFPMNTLADFKKAKIVTWFGTIEQNVLMALGASPIPMTVHELTPSIRSGVADTIIAPALWMVGSQMYTTVKYVNPVKIRYSPSAVIMRTETWAKLPDKYNGLLQKLRDNEVIKFNKVTRSDSIRSYKAMVKYGIKENIINADELEIIKERCKKLWFEMADKHYPKVLLEELINNLEEFRAKK